jgi:hypothetical protein
VIKPLEDFKVWPSLLIAATLFQRAQLLPLRQPGIEILRPPPRVEGRPRKDQMTRRGSGP